MVRLRGFLSWPADGAKWSLPRHGQLTAGEGEPGTLLTLRRLMPYIYINSVALVRERTIPTERPPPVGEVSANFCG